MKCIFTYWNMSVIYMRCLEWSTGKKYTRKAGRIACQETPGPGSSSIFTIYTLQNYEKEKINTVET